MSVLGKNEIRRRVEEQGEIFRSNYDPSQVQPAAYELRVTNKEKAIGDVISTSGSSERVFSLPKRQISVVSTLEVLDVPEDLCGRVGIRLQIAKKGLVALFGPQIDPGYEGRFYGVVYNASGEDIDIHHEMPFFKLELQDVKDGTRRTQGPKDITEFSIDHHLTDLSELEGRIVSETEELDEKLTELDAKMDKYDSRVTEVQQGYTQIVLFGVFLIATTVFGVMFTSMSSLDNLSFGRNIETVLIGLFLVGWLLPTIVLTMRAIDRLSNSDETEGSE